LQVARDESQSYAQPDKVFPAFPDDIQPYHRQAFASPVVRRLIGGS